MFRIKLFPKIFSNAAEMNRGNEQIRSNVAESDLLQDPGIFLNELEIALGRGLSVQVKVAAISLFQNYGRHVGDKVRIVFSHKITK